MEELNEEQLAAIGSTARTTVVPAGPGSGKTRTLIGRIRFRLAEGVDPKLLVAFTFTNAGANVIAQRLAPIKLGYIGTIHGYGMRLIQNHGYLIGYRVGGVSIVTEAAKVTLLKQAREKLGRAISDKEMMLRETQDAELIWREYEHMVKRANMIDYDRILVDAAAILQTDTQRFRPLAELLGDELQDSGPADWDIIWGIPADNRFLVGDVDQCIFVFRGADPMLFMRADTARRKEYPLELNYRSDVEICRAANQLIGFNENRIPKMIIPVSNKTGLVKVTEYSDEGREIYGVWGQICEIAAASTSHAVRLHKMNEIAVLARTNAIASKYREVLRGLGLPIKTTTVKLPADWSTVLTTLSLIVDPANNLHAEELLRLRGYPKAYITEQRIRATAHGTTLCDLLFPSLIGLKLMDCFNAVQVSQESTHLVMQRARTLPEDATVADLLADLWDVDRWNVTDHREGVTVGTIHAAKGQEWDTVFMVAMEEDILPSKQAKSTGYGCIEEERRVCFVGMTRARHGLYLSHVKERIAFFRTNFMTRSRFIKEMGL